MAKYVKTEQGYVDASIFAPAQFKPEGKSYLTFSSPNNFTLEVNNRTKNWDGILEYFASDKTWTVWDGTTILSGHNNDGEYVLYLRGTGNTKITGMGTNISWIITGTDIKCIGNIENLLDYATVASGKHPTMAKFCYYYMFYGCASLTQSPALPATTLANDCYDQMFLGCTSLTQAPELPATTLARSCYSQMFSGCTSLTQAPELPATTLAKSCYFSMFSNCTALTQAPTLPATTLEADCYNNMFYGCTSLTQAPALPATTLTEGCYAGMFSGCTALTQAPALPATTLENACYRSMFQGCTSLKLSSTKTGEYTQEYRIPSSGTGTIHGYALTDMFVSTGGTFTRTPAINTTYYLSTDNMIVRDTEVATLNGYVGSMIDNSVSNPLNITGATVGQIAKITAVDESGNPTEWEAVNPDYTLTVTVNTQDGVTVTGQTVTVRAGDADGPVYGTAEYNGQPVSFRVADGFAYYAEVTDNLAAHFKPTTVKGVINGANAAVTLLYNDFSTIQTAPDIQAALNADMDLTELVGRQITCQRGNDTLSWDVVDYDSTAKVVTLCMHDVLPDDMKFEPSQALMYCEDGLAAGSYTFKWKNTQCYFTLTQAIPVGGQLMATNRAFQTYESVTATAQIESGTVSTEAIDGATNLGQTGTGNLNHHDRANYGSNNFGESGILQWLNSDSPANTPLPRLTKFSRPYVPTKAGFKAGLDADFLACIQDTVWKCSANNVYECPASLGGIAKKGNPYTVTAKFALASEIEVFGEYGGTPDGGTVWDLYVGAEATDRIKYYNNTARSWWLRSPSWNSTCNDRTVLTSGAGNTRTASNSNGVAVACKIAKRANIGVGQPDWNQNDSTQPDYVKNRPFYTGNPVETVLVEESTVQFTDIGGVCAGAIESTFSPTVGNAYKVYWDGTDYESACVEVGQDKCIGNLSIDGSGPDTGEPFLMYVTNQGIDVVTLNYASYHTISISRFVPGVVKIDEKYLPDTIATKQYVDTAKTEAQQLGLTAATPGQIIKVKTVQDGKPTSWEAVDMPSGGGDEWELIAHINVADDVEKDVTVWEYNNLPRYKYIAYKKVNLVGSGDQTASGCTIKINNESNQPSGMTYGKSGSPQNCIGMIYVMPFGWTHYKTVDATSPNNIAMGGFNAMLTALPLSDNAITSIKLSAHTMYKIASGEIWLYGKKG